MVKYHLAIHLNSYSVIDWCYWQYFFCVQHTRRYGPLRGPTSSSCGGLRPSAEAFFALRARNELFMLFWPIYGDFWCPVVTVVTLSGKPKNQKNIKNGQKIRKSWKISKNLKNSFFFVIFFLFWKKNFLRKKKKKKMLSS